MNLNPFGPKASKIELPLVYLRELVAFPHVTTPFFIGKAAGIASIEEAMKQDRRVFLLTAKPEPPADKNGVVGTVAHVSQMLKLPDGSIRVVMEGQHRASIERLFKRRDISYVALEEISENRDLDQVVAARMSALQQSFRRYRKIVGKMPKEAISSIERAEYPDKLVDLLGHHLPWSIEKKLSLLEETDSAARLENAALLLETEVQVLDIQQDISKRVKERMEKNQRDYYLNEQVKEINRQLGKDDSDPQGDKELIKAIESRNPPQEVLDKANKEAARLSRLQPMSPESGVLRTYLEWFADLPWSQVSEDHADLAEAERVLDEDHYDMKKPKERILEFLAVRQLQNPVKGPILCFVGPPGTGKTSLGKSVARALGREFIRISLGGVRDEAEIRGHRKTYVGALPGKIIQSIRKAGTSNPVFLLDEIDKINSDFRGDPASALLEVLDPEQNSTFVDHYLEVPYNLSRVMFITTANSLHTIPYPLLDRMEIIEVPGYTELEKTQIAKKFIVPALIEENGLSWAKVQFRDAAIRKVIQSYTMESGVRNLKRELESIVRKIAVKAVKSGAHLKPEVPYSVTVSETSVSKYLGNEKILPDLVYSDNRPGLAHGLAWTELGGTILPVEVSILEGPGELILTGSLGEVMKESARIALSFLRMHHQKFGLRADFNRDRDIHVHVPEGAIPKDGPSAGITLTSALVSAFTGRSLRPRLAMTGEITLTGRIVAIGGVKEKVLAAHRNGMKTVLLPEENRKDLNELPKEVRKDLEFVFGREIMEALETVFDGPFAIR
jgi:ATP-dependent Lon protease